MSQLGAILLAKGLVTSASLQEAIDYQKKEGGQLQDSLIAVEAIDADRLQAAVDQVPASPRNLDQLDINSVSLLQLMIKAMYSENIERPTQISSSLKLTSVVINALLENAKDRRLVEAIGPSESSSIRVGEMRYALSGAGREWAVESLERCQYSGPAPVSLERYASQVMRQRIGNERVTRADMDQAFEDLVIPDRFLRRLGPAINSGSALLIHGPTGNGKTTIAQVVGHTFHDVVYIPYCFEVDGQIVKVFDPSVHEVIAGVELDEAGTRNLRVSLFDERWVPCYRPTVLVGGELTLEMLDLKFSEISRFYEAPMHIKALNGTFIIDDFGRQLAKPEDILNRWIVPLNNRVDYLNLHTGKNFQIPFDELVIFSTNLRPSDLMDPAFQRRLSYKLKTVAPSEDLFRRVFENVAMKNSLELTDEIFDMVLERIRQAGVPLAYFQPNFIVEQVTTSCRFEGVEPVFTRENVEDAMLNLFSDDDDDVDADH